MKVVLQEGRMDCGVCCLLSIIRFYGGEVSLEYLRKITNTNKDGVSAYNLIEAAKSFGMDACGMCGELENIDINNLPCIAHININANYQHFVVIYKIDSKKITIMDPAIGRRLLKLSEFKLMSTNNYIFFKVKKKLPIFNNQKTIHHLILNYITKNKLKFFSLSFITLNLIILDIVLAFNFKYIVTFCINYLNTVNIFYISICLIFINIIYSLILFMNKRLLYKVIFIFDEKITTCTFKQLLLLPYFYYNNRTVGEVLSRFNDLTNIKNFLIQFVAAFISEIISLFLFTLFLISINNRLSLLLIIYFLLCSVVVFSRGRSKKKLYKKVKLGEDTINSYIVESLSNVDTTKGSHLEKRFTDKFILKYRKFLEYNYKYLNHLDFNSIFIKLLENVLIILIYGLGGYYVITNKLRIENLIVFITFFQYSLNTFNKIVSFLEQIFNFKISLARVEELYTIMYEDFSKSYYFLSYKMLGPIVLNQLTYKIDNKVLLNNINLEINLGDKVLLFGNSGSGKSTLVKMLVRYVEVPFSMISIDGIDINHYHLENIRRYISYVSSNELLFNDSIYNNICLYKDVSEEVFLKVINICRVNEIFGNEIENYNALIEENGFLFSSGERQRIVLARSLIRNSSIYIFDEAFGQIDIDLTNKILNDMFDYLKDKIVIVISHRKSSKKYFNRVLKLMDGKIYEK